MVPVGGGRGGGGVVQLRNFSLKRKHRRLNTRGAAGCAGSAQGKHDSWTILVNIPIVVLRLSICGERCLRIDRLHHVALIYDT